MRYVMARIIDYRREMAYRIYMSDCLKGLSGADMRYYDIIKPVHEETRSSEEIIDHMKNKLALLGK